MTIDLSQFLQTFLEECAEHIVTIETGLLRLKSSAVDEDTLNQIFRAAHSIKGSAGTFGLSDLVQFAHVLENLFDRMRVGQIRASGPLLALLSSAVDLLKNLLDSKQGNPPPRFAELKTALESACIVSQTGCQKHYRVSFRPLPQFFYTGSDPLLLLRNLSAEGLQFSATIDTQTLPPILDLVTDLSYLGWQIKVTTQAEKSLIEDVFEFAIDDALIEISEEDQAVRRVF